METVVATGSSDEEPQSSQSTTPSPSPDSKAKAKSSFFIGIRPSTKYTPGCGPALQPLRLLPPATCSAHIIERILLPSPGLAADGKPLPRRMTYIVGWRDLPAASLLVPAMNILDYVSPRVLESWEETLEEELDKERIKFAMARKMASMGVKQKQKARPPTHTDIEPAAAIEPETEAEDAVRPKTGAISLSTPQKRKLADFEGLTEDEESPSNQLSRETIEEESREDSWDILLNKTRKEDVLIESVKSVSGAVDSDGPEEPKRSKVNTPVPLPLFINGIMGYGNSSIRTKPLPAQNLTPDDASNHPKHANSVASTGGTTYSSAARNNISTSGSHLANTANTRESIGVVAGDTSAIGTANGPAQKLKRQQTPQKKRKTSPPIRMVGKDEEPTWEVERLEDVAYYDVEGRGIVRYFVVRWAGDWPPGQQTSWEPEENIPRNLIRRYFRTGKKRRAKLASQHRREYEPRGNVGSSAVSASQGSVNNVFAPEEQGQGSIVDGTREMREEESLFVEDDMDHEMYPVELGQVADRKQL
ncbi:hypothetical protein ED733_000450 [Metarhizium rileyi]|uniref:Chromo domain-containing protein n=1 Tax=Metarhizium rileyi (strain RCEF 4871) TaxID=1649241 RepID=A0A5C6FZI1_METRR|nr:hypothetical protein ED733_000450 [Metarhizium rileyi]